MATYLNVQMEKIRKANPQLAQKITEQHFDVTLEDLQQVAAIDPTTKVVVRCNAGRFTVAADQAEHFVKIIDDHRRLLATKFRTDDSRFIIELMQQAKAAGHAQPDWVRNVMIYDGRLMDTD